MSDVEDDANSLNGRFSPDFSDRRSIYSYTSSLDREFILKDVHGRVFNNTNEVNPKFGLLPPFLLTDATEFDSLISYLVRLRVVVLPFILRKCPRSRRRRTRATRYSARDAENQDGRTLLAAAARPPHPDPET